MQWQVWLRQRALRVYFFLTYLFAWSIWWPMVRVGQGWQDGRYQPMCYVLGFMTPMVAAVLVTAVTEGRVGLRTLLGGLTQLRVGWPCYLLVLGLPPLLFGIAVALNAAITGNWPSAADYGRLDDMFPGVGLAGTAVLHLIVGIGEEIGWRGFALPRLQSKQTALRATVILSLWWGGWHLPTFLFHNTLTTGLAIGLFFTLITFPIAVTYTWLYNSTQGSTAITSLWSTSLTLAIGSAAAIENIPMLMTLMIFLVAILLIRRSGVELGRSDLAAKRGTEGT
jgi:membrane protease YdiL (CAAX protease family)